MEMFNRWLRAKKILSELLSCHAGCNVEHFLQNGFRTVFCEVMGTGRWDRRVNDDFFRGTNPNQFWVQRSAQAEALVSLQSKFSVLFNLWLRAKKTRKNAPQLPRWLPRWKTDS